MATILYIEDHSANRILIERILSKRGYELIFAADGESGIEAAIDHLPDLILIDMGLPDMDGQTVVTLLKQLSYVKDKPMVAITAWPAEKAYEIAERYDLAGCILKPIDVKTFPETIASFLVNAHQGQEEA